MTHNVLAVCYAAKAAACVLVPALEALSKQPIAAQWSTRYRIDDDGCVAICFRLSKFVGKTIVLATLAYGYLNHQ